MKLQIEILLYLSLFLSINLTVISMKYNKFILQFSKYLHNVFANFIKRKKKILTLNSCK